MHHSVQLLLFVVEGRRLDLWLSGETQRTMAELSSAESGGGRSIGLLEITVSRSVLGVALSAARWQPSPSMTQPMEIPVLLGASYES